MLLNAIPDLLRTPWRLVPDALHARVLANGFNHFLRGQPLAARLHEIEGRTVCLHVTDADSRVYLRVADGKLRAIEPAATDVTIRGGLADFWALATRQEDPDTLFFHRRLGIEGSTEVGLHVKNLLDALDYDWEAHYRAVLGPLAQLAIRLHRRLPLAGRRS